jgi:hypothetical protein
MLIFGFYHSVIRNNLNQVTIKINFYVKPEKSLKSKLSNLKSLITSVVFNTRKENDYDEKKETLK